VNSRRTMAPRSRVWSLRSGRSRISTTVSSNLKSHGLCPGMRSRIEGSPRRVARSTSSSARRTARRRVGHSRRESPSGSRVTPASPGLLRLPRGRPNSPQTRADLCAAKASRQEQTRCVNGVQYSTASSCRANLPAVSRLRKNQFDVSVDSERQRQGYICPILSLFVEGVSAWP
jgi:hypothetical protein